MLKRRSQVKRQGFHAYSGDHLEICRDIVESCWNGTYFQTSNGHFKDFYLRDFAFCVKGLLRLGYRTEAKKTLLYSIEVFKKKGHVTTTISPDKQAYDVPRYAADSLPLLVHAIRQVDPTILRTHERFFLQQIQEYYDKVFDPDTSLVTTRTFFSSIKDLSERYSSTYDNCMLSMLRDDLTALGFFNPLKEHDIKNAILKTLWNGRFFYEDTTKQNIVTGDANVFPFWCGVISSRDAFGMFRPCLHEMQQTGLDTPFPLKYSSAQEPIGRMVWFEPFSGGYERDTIWAHLGLCFLEVVQQYHEYHFQSYLRQYQVLIEKYKTFLEVFDRKGSPFTSTFYTCDEAMLWAAWYHDLATKDKISNKQQAKISNAHNKGRKR